MREQVEISEQRVDNSFVGKKERMWKDKGKDMKEMEEVEEILGSSLVG